MIDAMKREYPCVIDIIAALNIHLSSKGKDEVLDISETVYDLIGEWDIFFADDDEWYSEEDTDIKDSLHDQVIAIIES